jgi:hypothetical protein
MKFHVAAIDRQIKYDMTDPFNTNYMRTVFAIGYAKTMAGKVWQDKPVFRQ